MISWKNEFGGYLFPLCSTFGHHNKKSNRSHNFFSYIFSFILTYIGTYANVQNNYIKWSCFGTDFTRSDFCSRKWETLLGDKKFLNSENVFGVFHNQPLRIFQIFQYFLFYCRLNSTGNDLFSGKNEIQRQKKNYSYKFMCKIF